MLPYLILGLGMVSNATGIVFAKRLTNSLMESGVKWTSPGSIVPALISNINLYMSLLLFGCGFLAYLFTISRINLHIAYPIFVSVVMILVTIASAVLFAETIHLKSIVGIVIIIIGIFVLATAR